MKATDIKRWFKQTFDIPVRCETSPHYIGVWIPSEHRPYKAGEPIVYKHSFPPELGHKCMQIVYKGYPTLEMQNWGGNIQSNMISMRQSEWTQLFAQYGVTL